MKSVFGFLKQAITFNSLGKKEMQDVCGRGKMCWNLRTNTLYYVPDKPLQKA